MLGRRAGHANAEAGVQAGTVVSKNGRFIRINAVLFRHASTDAG